MTEFDTPAPAVTAVSRPFWDGCAEGVLLYQHCEQCGEAQFPPSSRCRTCGGSRLEWRRSAGEGEIHSATRVYRAPTAAFQKEAPYTLALVDLAEGFRLLVDVRGAPEAEGLIGQPIRILFRKAGGGFSLPQAELR